MSRLTVPLTLLLTSAVLVLWAIARSVARARLRAVLQQSREDGLQQLVLAKTHELEQSNDALRHSAQEEREAAGQLENQRALIENISVEIAQDANEESLAMQQMQASSGGVIDSAAVIGTSVAEIAHVAANARHQAHSAVEAMGLNSEAMQSIESASEEIVVVVNLVAELSRQIRILALNASIEAQRAGDSGAGFAVVAAEVRALAGRSDEAAKQIAGLMKNSRKSVQMGMDVGANSRAALDELLSLTDAIHVELQRVTEQIDVQAHGVEALTGSLEAMAAASSRTANAAQHLLQESRKNA